MNVTGDRPLRIGILGAARIAPMALTRPAQKVPGAEVLAVAARNPAKARAFAAKRGVPRVHPTYDALLADPDIDAIYNPLPNSLHCEWTIKALEGGKHVLCEKPMASNTVEAQRMAEVAAKTGLVLAEAFHYRYHPLAARMKEIVASGTLGTVRHVGVQIAFPLLLPRDIRYRYDLGGGATMDAGCYAINLIRFLSGAEPTVTDARARLISQQVDRSMEGSFEFDDGCSAHFWCSLLSHSLYRLSAEVRGDRGYMRVFNFLAPQFYHRLSVQTIDGSSVERIAGEATYTLQLRAFVAAVRGEAAMPTDAQDAIANMRVIDAVYQRAGLNPRGTQTPPPPRITREPSTSGRDTGQKRFGIRPRSSG